MLPFNGAPPARGFPQAPGAPPPRPISAAIPPMGLLPRGMPPPRPMGAPFVHPGVEIMPSGAPVVLGPRGVGVPPVGAPVQAASGAATALYLQVMDTTESQQDPGPVNIFVGKLPPDLHDNYIRRLLETCGVVATWKRTSDPVTHKPKGFGYCTYVRTLDVLRALRLLNGFAIDSRQILLKVDSKSQEKLDAFERALPEHVRAEEQAVDESVRQTLRAIYEDRSGVKGGHQNDVASWGDLIEGQEQNRRGGGQVTTSNAVGSGDKGANVDAGGGEAVDNDSNGGSGGKTEGSDAPGTGEKVRGKMIMSEIEKFRLAQKERDQELERKRHEAVRERLRIEREQEESRKAAEEKRQKQELEAFAAEKKTSEKKQAREERKRQRDADAVVEADKRKDVKVSDGRNRGDSSSRKQDGKTSERRERSRSSGREIRRQKSSRSRSRSLERRDSRSSRRHRRRSRDERRSASRSRSQSHSRHRSDRHRSKRRSRSQSRDRRVRHRRRNSSDVGASDVVDDGRRREPERKRHRKSSTSEEKKSENHSSRSPRGGRSDKSTRRGSTQLSSVDEGLEASTFNAPPKPSIKELPKVVLGLKLQPSTTKKDKPVPAASFPLAFGVEEAVKVKPKREIVPIDYTEEERASSSAEESAPVSESVDANRLKALIEQIPADKDALFEFPIDWAVVDVQGLVESKMRAWVSKKMLEYLGEEEPTMADFVLAKLREHVRPQVILGELRLVLEDEADVFVALLWRKLAFEAARANQL